MTVSATDIGTQSARAALAAATLACALVCARFVYREYTAWSGAGRSVPSGVALHPDDAVSMPEDSAGPTYSARGGLKGNPFASTLLERLLAEERARRQAEEGLGRQRGLPEVGQAPGDRGQSRQPGPARSVWELVYLGTFQRTDGVRVALFEDRLKAASISVRVGESLYGRRVARIGRDSVTVESASGDSAELLLGKIHRFREGE